MQDEANRERVRDDEAMCVCCCRPLSAHNRKRQCPETSYFIPNVVAPTPSTSSIEAATVERCAKVAEAQCSVIGAHPADLRARIVAAIRALTPDHIADAGEGGLPPDGAKPLIYSSALMKFADDEAVEPCGWEIWVHTTSPMLPTAEAAYAWAHQYIAASQAAALPPAAQPGMVLVPREPTEAMLRAGLGEMRVSSHADRGVALDVWKQMLAAAPIAGQGEGK